MPERHDDRDDTADRQDSQSRDRQDAESGDRQDSQPRDRQDADSRDRQDSQPRDRQNSRAPERREDRPADNEPFLGTGAAGWFAASTLRVGLALIGFILLLFAIGQAAGFDLLGLFVEALSSQVGGWLVVAFFALLIIVVAARGFGTWSR